MPDKSLLDGDRGICFCVAPANVGINRRTSSTSLCWKNLCQLFTCRQNQLVQINSATLDGVKMSTAQIRIGLDLSHYIRTSVNTCEVQALCPIKTLSFHWLIGPMLSVRVEKQKYLNMHKRRLCTKEGRLASCGFTARFFSISIKHVHRPAVFLYVCACVSAWVIVFVCHWLSTNLKSKHPD